MVDDETESGPSGDPPQLTTERLLLRPFRTQGDPEIVQQILQCREIAANTRTIQHPYPPGAALEWIRTLAGTWESGQGVVFAICEIDSPDCPIGAIGLHLEPEHESAEMGYWIDEKWWGRGVATEAAARVVQFGFEDLALQKIHAHHLGNNLASGKVLSRAGLRKEGTFRRHIKKWGVFRDTVHYGICACDWNAPGE